VERAAWDPQTEPTAPSDVSEARTTRLNKVSVSTLCTSKAEFISKFRPFLDETTIFFASRLPLVIGQPVAFAICLKDRQPMLEGDGKIIEVQPLPGPSGRAGLRIQVRAFTSGSLPMWDATRATWAPGGRGPAGPPPPPTPVASAPPPVASAAPPVHPPAPLPPPSRAVRESRPLPRALGATANVLPLVPPGERRQGAPDTLPANPFAEVSADSLSFYIESNLSESAEPHHVGIPSPEDSDLESPAIHRNLLVRVLSWRAPATLPPAVRIAVPMAASSLLTLVACWAIWGRAPHPAEVVRPATVTTAAPAPARAATPTPTPVPAAPVMAPPVVSAPAASAPAVPATSPATSGCLVRIASRPAGATVIMGKRRLGRTPLQAAAVPCGKQVITVSHARYSSVTEEVVPTPGTAASSFVRLPRPPAQLTLTSTPAGATFRVNRTKLNPSSGPASVLRFERVRIEARLPGYRPWRETLYVAAAVTRVNARLVPLASGAPRRR
jgi:hypothetical protein